MSLYHVVLVFKVEPSFPGVVAQHPTSNQRQRRDDLPNHHPDESRNCFTPNGNDIGDNNAGHTNRT